MSMVDRRLAAAREKGKYRPVELPAERNHMD